jgi:hypothetical protein
MSEQLEKTILCRNCGKPIRIDEFQGKTGWRHSGSLLVRCSPLRLKTLAEPKEPTL